MIYLYLLLILPICGTLSMLVWGHKKIAGYINISIHSINFVNTILLTKHFLHVGTLTIMGKQFYLDAFNLLMLWLTTFTIMNTAVFSHHHMWNNLCSNRINSKHLRIYHILFQIFTLISLIILTTNNIGILWVTLEGATLATALLVSMYRTKEAIEAAWKYFILGIVGIAIALFGTILVYFSATQAIPQFDLSILWSVLVKYSINFDPILIKIAFIFLLVGYGTKIGFVPLHNWLPDAYAESPSPVTILLSGLLSNISLYTLIRFKILIDQTLNNNFTGYLLMGFGFLSFIVGAILIQRQRDIKRIFAYSSIEHMGLIAIAFGIGSKMATLVGILYLLVHSLAKSAAFMITGNITQQTGTKILGKTRGLIKSAPTLGWGLIIATSAIAAIPPFGIFTSEFMLFIASTKFSLFLSAGLILGLVIALAGLFYNMQTLVYGEPTPLILKKTCIYPAFIHLGIVLTLGIYLPPPLKQLLQTATTIITHHSG